MVEQRRWSDACRVLAAAIRVRERDSAIDQMMAVAATHAGKRRLAHEAIVNLRSELEPTVASINALTEVALARRQYQASDLLARKAIELEPTDADSWANLAAGFAGLGWFDQAGECLDRADELGLDESRHWIIGRAVNSWALTRTWASVFSAVLFVFVGLMAVAVGLTLPFLVREVRLTQLDGRFAAMATTAWRTEHRLRMMHAAAVLSVLGVWVAILALT